VKSRRQKGKKRGAFYTLRTVFFSHAECLCRFSDSWLASSQEGTFGAAHVAVVGPFSIGIFFVHSKHMQWAVVFFSIRLLGRTA
jgi:hypothetical protein